MSLISRFTIPLAALCLLGNLATACALTPDSAKDLPAATPLPPPVFMEEPAPLLSGFSCGTIGPATFGSRREKVEWQAMDAECRHQLRLAARLYTQAATLDQDRCGRQYYLGKAALCLHNWDAAWSHFEKIHQWKPDDAGRTRGVMWAYNQYRDCETCIWMTRYLRIAPDWLTFNEAYNRRSEIEYKHYRDSLKSEKRVNYQWKQAELPIRVWIEKDGDSSGRLKDAIGEALESWVVASGGRLAYVFSDNATSANVVIGFRSQIKTCYAQYHNLTKAPHFDVAQLPRAVTDTTPKLDQDGKYHPGKTQIIIYLLPGEALRDCVLESICLHELGHALGLYGHSTEPADLMYAFCNESSPHTRLSANDKKMIETAYHDYPMHHSFLPRFNGGCALSINTSYIAWLCSSANAMTTARDEQGIKTELAAAAISIGTTAAEIGWAVATIIAPGKREISCAPPILSAGPATDCFQSSGRMPLSTGKRKSAKINRLSAFAGKNNLLHQPRHGVSNGAVH